MSTTQVNKILKAAKINLNGVAITRGRVAVEVAHADGRINGRASDNKATRIYRALRNAGLEVSSRSGGYGVYMAFGKAASVMAQGMRSADLDQFGAGAC